MMSGVRAYALDPQRAKALWARWWGSGSDRPLATTLIVSNTITSTLGGNIMKIAVIGSCHLDTIAQYGFDGCEVDQDVPGSRIDYSVGGAAYNVAVHLCDLGHDIRFMTIVGKHTLSELIVRNALKDRRIDDSFICVRDTVAGHGHVALAKHGQMERAVTFTAFDEGSLIDADLSRLLRGAGAVVIDSNLSVVQITQVCSLAGRRNIPVFGVVASDAKAHRFVEALIGLPSEFAYRLICFNELEAGRLFPDGYAFDDHSKNAARLRADVICCSMGRGGQSYSTYSGCERFPAYSLTYQGTAIGAGDALFACLCHHLIGKDRTQTLNLREMDGSCADRVRSVLNLPWATKDAATIGASAVRNRSHDKIAALALLLFILLVVGISAAVSSFDRNHGVGFGMLIAAGTAFGLLGSLIAILFDQLPESDGARAMRGWNAFQRSCFGAIVGGLTSLIYLVPPLLANASLVIAAGGGPPLPLAIMICFMGLAAGFIGPRALRRIVRRGEQFGEQTGVARLSGGEA
ncbi:MAG TPA: carbohydrate kinase family protein [Allosphingosinicella sp.]|nr:carbohydrate kinase family protein [Allosphingosinicella sp.]